MPEVYINTIRANDEDVKDLKIALTNKNVILMSLQISKEYIIIETN